MESRAKEVTGVSNFFLLACVGSNPNVGTAWLVLSVQIQVLTINHKGIIMNFEKQGFSEELSGQSILMTVKADVNDVTIFQNSMN